jgi:hypothetical protein
VAYFTILPTEKDTFFLCHFVMTGSGSIQSAARLVQWAVFPEVNLSEREAPFCAEV